VQGRTLASFERNFVNSRLLSFTRTMLSTLLFSAVLTLASTAHAQNECFPTCRDGFVCSPKGQCVSACNPPCSGSETCRAGVCSASSSTNASTEAPKSAPESPSTSKTSDAPPAVQHFTLAAGPKLYNATSVSGFGGELAFQYRVPLGADFGRHGFVAGIRAGAIALTFDGGFGSVKSFAGSFALDLGYSGRYRWSGGNAGPLLMLTPEVFPAKKTAYGAGLTAGGRVQFGDSFELQLPLTVSYLATGSSSSSGLAFQGSLLGGLSF
jgi:hypothetical protein